MAKARKPVATPAARGAAAAQHAPAGAPTLPPAGVAPAVWESPACGPAADLQPQHSWLDGYDHAAVAQAAAAQLETDDLASLDAPARQRYERVTTTLLRCVLLRAVRAAPSPPPDAARRLGAAATS